MSLLDAQEHAASVLTSHEAVKDLVAAAFDDYDLVDQPAPHFHNPPPERIPALVHPHSEVCFLLSLTCSCLLAPCPHVCPPPQHPPHPPTDKGPAGFSRTIRDSCRKLGRPLGTFSACIILYIFSLPGE